MGLKQTVEKRTSVKSGVGRLCFVGISILLQAIWLFTLLTRFNQYSHWISGAVSIMALFVVLMIQGQDQTSAMKTPWIILILVLPLLGLSLYLMIGTAGTTRRMNRMVQEMDERLGAEMQPDTAVLAELRERDKAAANLAQYVANYRGGALYKDTKVTFYPRAVEGLAAQKVALQSAKRFIFMEYHAIEDAEAFAEIHDILKQKAAEGVDVRMFYDDMGSIGFINVDFIQRMRDDGIECRVFNPMVPIINTFLNNRDHRKITVVDGEIGFTGGYNLANEYFDITHPYGQWKDTGVRLEGAAVQSLTALFLELWNAMRGHHEQADQNLANYLQITHRCPEAPDFVQPYGDNPLDDERMGENVYLSLIEQAQDYIYFTTPYLIITDEMDRALCLAAKRGVDVRIITPGIPDKKMVFRVTRSYYGSLVRRGVRIFEYTPGFCHAKQCVVDGRIATCGTINLDYRSLYHHFENGCLFYGGTVAAAIKADFEVMFPLCHEVSEQYRQRGPALRFGERMWRLVAPLL